MGMRSRVGGRWHEIRCEAKSKGEHAPLPIGKDPSTTALLLKWNR